VVQAPGSSHFHAASLIPWSFAAGERPTTGAGFPRLSANVGLEKRGPLEHIRAIAIFRRPCFADAPLGIGEILRGAFF
jgi:hypothetical protein